MIGLEAMVFSMVSINFRVIGQRSEWQTGSSAIVRRALQRHTSRNNPFHPPSVLSQIFSERFVWRDDTCAQILLAPFYKKKRHLNKAYIHALKMSLFQRSSALKYFKAVNATKSRKSALGFNYWRKRTQEEYGYV